MKGFLIEVSRGLVKFILNIVLGLLMVLVYWGLGFWELIKLSGKLLLRKPLVTGGFSLKPALDMFTASFVLIFYIWIDKEPEERF